MFLDWSSECFRLIGGATKWSILPSQSSSVGSPLQEQERAPIEESHSIILWSVWLGRNSRTFNTKETGYPDFWDSAVFFALTWCNLEMSSVTTLVWSFLSPPSFVISRNSLFFKIKKYITLSLAVKHIKWNLAADTKLYRRNYNTALKLEIHTSSPFDFIGSL